MIFQAAKSRKSGHKKKEMRGIPLKPLCDPDVSRYGDHSYQAYSPKAVTEFQACELPVMPQMERDSSEATETAHGRVFQSICNGDDPKNISIPSYRISPGQIVFYEVVTSNKNLRWNTWIRYDCFWRLHARLKRHAKNLCVELPSFPKKQPKWFWNHLSPDFIEERRVNLEVYLQMLNIDPTMRYAQDFISFLLPSPKDCSEGHLESLNFVEENIQGYGGTWDSSSEEEMELPPRANNILPLAMFMSILNSRET